MQSDEFTMMKVWRSSIEVAIQLINYAKETFDIHIYSKILLIINHIPNKDCY